MFDEIGSNILVTIETCPHQRDIIIIVACVYVGSVLNQTTHNSVPSTARSGLQGSWTPRCSAVHLNVSFDLESYNINMTISSSGSQRCAVLDKRSPAVAANFESSSVLWLRRIFTESTCQLQAAMIRGVVISLPSRSEEPSRAAWWTFWIACGIIIQKLIGHFTEHTRNLWFSEHSGITLHFLIRMNHSTVLSEKSGITTRSFCHGGVEERRLAREVKKRRKMRRMELF